MFLSEAIEVEGQVSRKWTMRWGNYITESVAAVALSIALLLPFPALAYKGGSRPAPQHHEAPPPRPAPRPQMSRPPLQGRPQPLNRPQPQGRPQAHQAQGHAGD